MKPLSARTDYERDLALAGRMADAVRPIALEWFRRDGTAIEDKPGRSFDPVTQADRGVEAEIRRRLLLERPEDGVLGEEEGATPGRSGRSWVIDPIDGTRAFIAGLPTWCVLIALRNETGPVLSVIDQPFTGERFSGVAGVGAWHEHDGRTRAMTTSRCVSVSDAIVSTTDPGLFEGAEAEAFGRIGTRAKVRRYGLDAYAYAMLALGGIDLVIESGLKPWDAAALVPIITGAGGLVTDWDGGPCHDGGRIVAAATPALHAEALAMLASV